MTAKCGGARGRGVEAEPDRKLRAARRARGRPFVGMASGFFLGEACAIEFLRCVLRGKSGSGAAALQKGVLRVRFLGADPFA